VEPAVELAASGGLSAMLRAGMHGQKAAIRVLLDLDLRHERRSDVATE
jgi:hypothetical protein